MSLWSRVRNVVRPRGLDREIDEELQSHLEEALKQGRETAEARRAFGSQLRFREESHDLRALPWLDSLRADIVFGWRQLKKRKITTAAAVLSLGLAMGACISAFRLIDALLFRPLPIADPSRLYSVAFQGEFAADGTPFTYDSCSYPMFRMMRAALQQQAELVAVSMHNGPVDLTYGSDLDIEKAELQYVSGWMFTSFGLHPALGQLITESDDQQPGHPVAVLSYDYWTSRFARDPKVIGRTFRLGNDYFQIAGVAEPRFTGTETGWTTDIFVPMAMKNPRILASLNNFWLRTLVQLKPGVSPEPVQERLRAVFRSIQEERVKGFPSLSKRDRDRMFGEKLSLEPAAAGRSNLQRDYWKSLTVLGLLVALVLMIACVNVANLMTAQAASRAREMALRVSIGAGRWRLIQLVLIESALLAFVAAAIGGAFAWWASPYIVDKISLPGYAGGAAHLVLPADQRLLGFGLALVGAVTCLFGLAPALRASAVQPVKALRGGEDPHFRRGLMHFLIAAQVAFCVIVHFAAGLFVASFERLSNQPTGFSSERILNVEALTASPQHPAYWDEVLAHLRWVPGVEKAALIGWPLMSGESAVGNISINGAPPGDVFSDFVSISPGWIDIMRIPFLGGRDFRGGDVNPKVAIVNQAFANQYFDGENPVGRAFERVEPSGARSRIEIVGWTRDARSRDNMRLPIRPTAYIPIQSIDPAGVLKPIGRGTFVVRTASDNPLALASRLRKEVPQARAGFRVSNLHAQTEFVRASTFRERLLAALAMFFATVALLLAGIGLYGVLDYTVLQRRREIGIRMALGAKVASVTQAIAAEVFGMVLAGAAVGLAAGFLAARHVATLLYQVKPSDAGLLAFPSMTIAAAALLAALPAVIRAARIDPAVTLRAE